MSKYYSLKNIMKTNAHYNIIIGERSNGKTYAALEYGLEQYFKTGKQFAIIRRWSDDFKNKRGGSLFDNHIYNGVIDRLSHGKYNSVRFQSSRWYLIHITDGEVDTVQETPFAYAFAISTMEHDKSTSFPNINTIIFDEFLTRASYLPNEFVLFMNVLSTIIRQRDDVKVFMLANTVNKYCPYFQEMGITNIDKMKPGTIDVYEYGNSGLKLAVEYCESSKISKASDKYFAFNNPHLNMIKTGAWELDIYPHLPYKYRPVDIIFTYFIEFNANVLQCEIIEHDGYLFTYIHRKTTPIKNDNDLVYTLEPSANNYKRTTLIRGSDKFDRRIYKFYQSNDIFYQDNEVGEIVRNFLIECGKIR